MTTPCAVVFQFTHPVRGATEALHPLGRDIGVSIHAPRAGCDISYYSELLISCVSIHAPRAGCDDSRLKACDGIAGFNSRTPCGVRRCRAVCRSDGGRFNSRTPCGVRQPAGERRADAPDVSIHAPRAGCDVAIGVRPRASESFNSRTPCGVRRPLRVGTRRLASFNSRTPCGVRLYLSTLLSSSVMCFNSRTPCGVRRSISR